MLCKKYYNGAKKKGEYTEIKGVTRDSCKALLLQHIEKYGKGYFKEFVDVLSDIPRNVISEMFHELRAEEKIEFIVNVAESGIG